MQLLLPNDTEVSLKDVDIQITKTRIILRTDLFFVTFQFLTYSIVV